MAGTIGPEGCCYVRGVERGIHPIQGPTTLDQSELVITSLDPLFYPDNATSLVVHYMLDLAA